MQDQFLNLYRRHSVANSAPEVTQHLNPRKYPQEKFISTLHKYSNNEWLKKHGKGNFIDFNSKQRARIRQIFKQLDKDGSGALGVDELFEPLLALGLVETKEQVKKMMLRVDTNQSGLIEFEEFIKIIKQNSSVNDTLVKFFKDLSNENITEDMKDLPFGLMLSNKRRELMLQGYLAKNLTVREQGQKIMNAFAQELKNEPGVDNKKERLKVKNEINIRKYIERQNCIRSAVEGIRGSRSSFITITGRPNTASKRPMTRRDILKLE
jgi:hypothetical protein